MNYIYLNDKQARKLFLNKYLVADKFKGGNRRHKKHVSLKFYTDNEIIKLNKLELILLSQFKWGRLSSKNERKVFVKNYDIPIGFFKINSEKDHDEFQFDENNIDFKANNLFLGIRRALLATFLNFYSEKSDLSDWCAFYDELTNLNDLVLSLIKEIIDLRDLPAVKPQHKKLAKETKAVLQYVYLGRKLGEILFGSNENKLDGKNKEWFKKLYPEKELVIDKVPERLQHIAEIIIAYILVIREEARKRGGVTTNENEITYENKGELSLEKIDFYRSFWMGILDESLNDYFHTSESAEILKSIEVKSFQLSPNTKELSCNYRYDENKIEVLKEIKNKKQRIDSARFKEFCKLSTGKEPKSRREEDLRDKISTFNLANKDLLIAFLSSDKYLYRLKEMFGVMKFKNVLIVFKYNIDILNNDDSLVIDVTMSKIKKGLSKISSETSIEVLPKNINKVDNRDIINNIQGFLNEKYSGNNLLYLSDATKKNQKEKEELWLGKALSPTPFFNREENYLFVK